ncbi:MAG: hypothetical protein ACRENE_08480 [Polyangiaceae bacterium]
MRGFVLGGVVCVATAAAACLNQQPQTPPPSTAEPDVAPTPVARAAPAPSTPAPAAPPPAASQRSADGAFAKALGSLHDARLAVDHDGVVVAASGGCGDDPGPLYAGTREPGTFVLLAKLDKNGHRQWSRAFFAACGTGDASAPAIAGVGIDKSGNIFVAGDVALGPGPLDFGGGALADGGGRDAFVASFDASGQHRWSKRFGNASDQRVKSVAVSPEGLVGITGSLEGTADFGNGVIKSAGKGDAFVAVFDAAGQHVASHAFGDPGEQHGELIAFGKMGELTLVGPYEGQIDFGGGRRHPGTDHAPCDNPRPPQQPGRGPQWPTGSR